MDVSPSLPANAQASEAVEPRDRALDHPAFAPQSAAMSGAASGDVRHDPASAQKIAVRLGVISAVGVETARTLSRAARDSPHRRNCVEQRDQLRNVVAVSSGQEHGQRDAVSVGEQVVLAARTPAIRWTWARLFPPLLRL